MTPHQRVSPGFGEADDTIFLVELCGPTLHLSPKGCFSLIDRKKFERVIQVEKAAQLQPSFANVLHSPLGFHKEVDSHHCSIMPRW
jgi:hypothetical protein